MLKVTLDENNYVTGWCMVGDNGGVDVDLPEDLDGFMDCTDSIMSRRDLEERQRIMKDPTVGSFAVVMVCFLLITWFACFYTVASNYWTLV